MITVKELKAFLADKDDDMDFDFLVTAIKWVVKTPEETVEEKAVEDELVD